MAVAELALGWVRGSVADLRGYSASKFRRDLVAGLTVAVVALPQSMAYAKIADVPLVYGIYTAIIQGLVAALFTSSSHLSTGPINTLSLLVASAVARITRERPETYVATVLAMTFLVGLLQIGFATARMATLVRYVSHSVIVGFTAGAGILIAAGQVPYFLGIQSDKQRNWPGLLGIFERMAPHFHEVSVRAMCIGTISLAIVLAARMISRFVPGPLLAAIFGGAVVAFMGWTGGQVQIVGDLPRGLPSFTLPQLNWATAEAFLGGALALSVVGMLEAFSIAKQIAASTGQRIDPTREFVAQGAANLVSSFFHCIPGSGSFSRSALNYQAGAATRLAGVFNSLFIAAIFLAFTSQAKYIPQASLAAILFAIAYGLVDWRYFVQVVRCSKEDALVCLVTFVATLVIPLEFAIFVGIFLNIGLYLRTASKLHLAEMVQMPAGGRFMERPLSDRIGGKPVVVLQVEGDLFFGLADELQDRLGLLATSDVRVVIFRLRRTHSVDATVVQVLSRFVSQMTRRGRHVILCGLATPLKGTLRAYGLVDLIGRENVFVVGDGVFASVRQAVDRAKHLVGVSIDISEIDLDEEPEAIVYHI